MTRVRPRVSDEGPTASIEAPRESVVADTDSADRAGLSPKARASSGRSGCVV